MHRIGKHESGNSSQIFALNNKIATIYHNNVVKCIGWDARAEKVRAQNAKTSEHAGFSIKIVN